MNELFQEEWLDHLKKFRNFFSPLKSKFLHMVFIVLKSSRGIVRKSQKVSAFNFDPKRVKKGAPRDLGPT